ncbi:transposase [Agrobacterium larrymoorei]|uniref:transposase n=1 Tax=Agrobacterium larrymoorei TaxID=160699 RepID=UPI00286CDC1F|nr:transposase [Agrobacterium larrymoorei]
MSLVPAHEADCPCLRCLDAITKPPHVWADAGERTDAHRKTARGKALYKRRRETAERSFADAKQLARHCYARFRGLTKVRWQCLLAAAAENIKKIAMAVTKAPRPAWGRGHQPHLVYPSASTNFTIPKQKTRRKIDGFVGGLSRTAGAA